MTKTVKLDTSRPSKRTVLTFQPILYYDDGHEPATFDRGGMALGEHMVDVDSDRMRGGQTPRLFGKGCPSGDLLQLHTYTQEYPTMFSRKIETIWTINFVCPPLRNTSPTPPEGFDPSRPHLPHKAVQLQ